MLQLGGSGRSTGDPLALRELANARHRLPLGIRFTGRYRPIRRTIDFVLPVLEISRGLYGRPSMPPRRRQLAHQIDEIRDNMAQLTVTVFAGMVMEKRESECVRHIDA
jgi:hypothetical protein